MTIYYKEGDAIKGDKIVAESRKLSKPLIVIKTGRHKAQQIVLTENAFCAVKKKLRFLPEAED